MTGEVEPLDSILWFERVELIASGSLRLENSLRHAAHLLHLTPAPFRGVMRLAVDEENFEQMLADGDFGAAARHLIGQPTSLAVEYEDNRQSVRATISCAILHKVIEATGETEALAILNAWATCVLALKAEFGEDLSKLRRREEEPKRLAIASQSGQS